MIKFIQDEDYNRLLELYMKYQLTYRSDISWYEASLGLNETLSENNHITIGLYREDKLVGFLLGYGNHLDNVYIEPKYRYHTKKLVDFYEDTLREFGYKGWTANSLTNKSSKYLNHSGAKILEIKYYKEL